MEHTTEQDGQDRRRGATPPPQDDRGDATALGTAPRPEVALAAAPVGQARLRALLQERRELAARAPGLNALDALLQRWRKTYVNPRVVDLLTTAASVVVCTTGPLLVRLRAPLSRARSGAMELRDRQHLRLLGLAGAVLRSQQVVRALPDYGGAFELDLRSHVTRPLLLGRFERALLPLLRAALAEQAGDVIDVGANVGLYSVLCAGLVQARGGRVLAVEPAPTVLPLLRANLARSGLGNVTVYAGALSSGAGHASLCYTVGNEEYAALGPPSHPQAPARFASAEVPTEALDTLVERLGLQPRFLKIDTEGAEALVLAGAQRTLAQHRPVVMSELDDRLLGPRGASARAVLEGLEGGGYEVYDAFSGARLRAAALTTPFVGEILALPAEAA